MSTSTRDTQVGGGHYKKYKTQPWDIIDEYRLTYYEGNALKYLLRAKGNRLEDLQKLRHYVDKLIEIEMKVEKVEKDLSTTSGLGDDYDYDNGS